jgi:SAM-dependent methyltransferase
MVTESIRNGLEHVDTQELAKMILKHASASTKEEDLKIRVEVTLRPILEKWGIQWASYEHGHKISGGRKDALYGHVILEYKSPSKLDSKAEFRKAKEQVKEYVQKQCVDKRDYSKYFAVIIDGYKISFVRFRSGQWEEQEEPLSVNKETIRTLLRAIRGLRLKIIDPKTLVTDFGPGELSKKVIELLYDNLRRRHSKRTQMLFEDWKRVFSQVCAYSPEKLSALIEYYGLKQKDIDIEKLMFCIHTYYTLLMKLITSEVISYFNPMFGSFLDRIETAYHTKLADMKKELEDLEEGGIIAQLGVRNLLEADYFAWYLDEWSKEIAELIMVVVEQLKEYDPGSSELYPERVKDLFKRLYQNLVPRKVRHDLGEYFTPDWLADLVLDEVGYEGNPDKRLLDPACGSGTFLVLAISRVKAWAEREFYPDKKELLRRIAANVIGIDLNPLAVLAAKANYVLALGELNRLLPGLNIDIPVYLADSILVSRKQSVSGELEVYLKTTVGDFMFPNEIIDKKHLPKALALIEMGMRGKYKYTKDQLHDLITAQLKGLKATSIDSLTGLFVFIRKLEKEGKNRIWTRLLKNSFAPLLMGKFSFIVGNPPWINWESLPEKYRDDTRQLWDSYGLLEKTEGMGLGKVKRDMAMLFTARCLDRYAEDHAKFGFLVPYTVYKTQAGAGFRRFLARGIHDTLRNVPCKVLKIHDLVTLYPFEGAVNRTSLVVIEKDGATSFPIRCLTWYNPKSAGIDQEASLEEARKSTDFSELVFIPIDERRPTSPWMQIRETAYEGIKKALHESPWYDAHEGVNTALNGVYWIQILSKQPTGLIITNPPFTGQKKKMKQVRAVVERDLVYPFTRGRDVKKWYVKQSCHILLPIDGKGDTIPHSEMKTHFPQAYQYFLNFYEDLVHRGGEPYNSRLAPYRKTSIAQAEKKAPPFYWLFNVAPVLAPYKVVWKRVAGKISGKAEFSAAVMGTADDALLGAKPTIPYEKLMLIPLREQKEAHYVAAVLNSSIVQTIVASYLVEQSISDITKHIKIPKFDPKTLLHVTLSQLSVTAHELATKYYEKNDEVAREELGKVQDQVDEACAHLYGISDEELEEIKRTLQILREGESEETEDEEESSRGS